MNIGVFGASGRMGQIIGALANEKGFKAFWGGYGSNAPFGFQLTTQLNQYFYSYFRSINIPWEKIDVFIDFSEFTLVSQNASIAHAFKKPYLCGVTGLTEETTLVLKNLATKIPVLLSSNFSLGILILKKMLPIFSEFKDFFDFQIEEIHHRYKKDAPSGTAKNLYEELNLIINNKSPLPSPISIRGGGVYGEHTILMLGDYEVLKISHNVFDRKVFGLGAIKASLWLVNQKPGFYSFDQIFNK